MSKSSFSDTAPINAARMPLLALAAFVFAIAIFALPAHAQQGTGGASVHVNLLNVQPDPVRAGDSFLLRMQVANTGSETVEGMQVAVEDSYPFSSTGMTRTFTIYPYQSDRNVVNLEFRVLVDKSARNGDYQLKIRYKYPGGDWITTNFTVSVTNKEFAQIIYVDQASIAPGKQTPLNFTITNIGDAPLQNLVFSWSDSKGLILPVYSDNTKYIKHLDAGESVVLTYIVVADVNAEPGLDQLDLRLGYESSSNATPSILQTRAGVLIGGETDFDVAFSESTAGATSLSVANTGNNPAQSVTVTIPEQPGYRVSGATSSIIGNLNKGDYTLTSFQITQRNNTGADGTAPGGNDPSTDLADAPRQRLRQNGTALNGTGSRFGGNNLLVQIDYTDTTGQRRSVMKEVPIQFRGMTGAGGSTGAYGQRAQSGSGSVFASIWFWAVAIIIVGAAVFLYRRKGKK